MEGIGGAARGYARNHRPDRLQAGKPRYRARRKLDLTQAEFAERFGISAATLRKWEQGVRKPQGPARVLLAVIDREPEAVMRALAPAPQET